MELMVSLLLTSFLSVILVTTYSATQKRFQLVMALSVMQDDAEFLITFLRDKINNAGDLSCVTSKSVPIVQVFSKESTPNELKSQLHNESDVLILGTCEISQGKKKFIQTAYYVTTTSWKEHGSVVRAFFEKSLNGSRQELVSHVVDFKSRLVSNTNVIRGVGYEVMFHMSHHVYRTWYGFGVIRHG